MGLLMYFCKKLVGMGGFEPPTFCSQSRRANQTALHPDKTFL